MKKRIIIIICIGGILMGLGTFLAVHFGRTAELEIVNIHQNTSIYIPETDSFPEPKKSDPVVYTVKPGMKIDKEGIQILAVTKNTVTFRMMYNAYYGNGGVKSIFTIHRGETMNLSETEILDASHEKVITFS